MLLGTHGNYSIETHYSSFLLISTSDFCFTTLSIAGLRWKVEVKKKTSPHLFTIQLFFQNAIFFFSIFIFSRCIQIALFTSCLILAAPAAAAAATPSLLLAQHLRRTFAKLAPP